MKIEKWTEVGWNRKNRKIEKCKIDKYIFISNKHSRMCAHCIQTIRPIRGQEAGMPITLNACPEHTACATVSRTLIHFHTHTHIPSHHSFLWFHLMHVALYISGMHEQSRPKPKTASNSDSCLAHTSGHNMRTLAQNGFAFDLDSFDCAISVPYCMTQFLYRE